MKNRIAVIAMVKNEEDIIESFARHACSFADLLLIGDHHSSDRTIEILESLQSESLPIRILPIIEQKLDHAAGLTKLTWQAIDLGADIVLPMDADEFIVQSNGNSESLRRDLQSLDPEKCYSMPWVNFELIAPEHDADRFTLSRDFLREQNPNQPPKVCIGAKIAKKTSLSVMKGGHHVLLPRGILDEEPMAHAIFSAHFPKRSAGQILSKTMGGWIGHILRFGRYTRLSYDWAMTNADYLEKNIAPEYHLEHPIETRELDGFRFECANRYTIGNIDPLKNLYRIAENLAIEKFRAEILNRREIVRIYILFDGDVQATIDSLKTALDQTYPFRKIFIIAASNQNLDALFIAAEDLNMTEEVGLINPDDPVIFAEGGGFAQFVTAGDKLQPEKVFRSIEAIYSDSYDHAIVVCLGKDRASEFLPSRFISPREWIANIFDGRATINSMLERDSCFSSGISGFLIRQQLLTRNFDLIHHIRDSAQMKFFDNLTERFGRFVFMNEDLVEKSCEWTREDRLEFEKIREELLRK